MRVDQHGKHAQRFVVLDKSHPAHIGREIVDLFNAPGRVAAGVHVAQIQQFCAWSDRKNHWSSGLQSTARTAMPLSTRSRVN